MKPVWKEATIVTSSHFKFVYHMFLSCMSTSGHIYECDTCYNYIKCMFGSGSCFVWLDSSAILGKVNQEKTNEYLLVIKQIVA